ncbi:MAG: copper homeostasis protein CutC [Bacteroides sp.]|nr:copper homeostasis protein CutC [Bacteroides sp.]MCM1413414.1 copper homeostasis protein CutC [Bacteroides sp.]MCM1471375.1 copper homeostasis protein CutC [Bacteroides sp.]
MKNHLVKLEICCADIQSVVAANVGGADRIELCSSLSEGGITPSAGFIAKAVEMSQIPVNVLIRPRGGDFVYSDAEADIMLLDIQEASQCGASGVVIGALHPDGSIDLDLCGEMCHLAGRLGLSVTFHRAFDMCRDPFTAARRIIDLKCDRLLTSGQAASAVAGAPLIRRLQEEFADRLTIMAGAGVKPENVGQLVGATGVSEVHASASTTLPSSMTWRNDLAYMGSADNVDEYSRNTTSQSIVESLSKIIHSHKA